MTGERRAAEARVAERAARSGAGLLLAVMFVSALSSGDAGRPAARRAALRIDPNAATRAELMLLPEVGEVRADAILAERAATGQSLDSQADLDRVPGIGPRRLEKLAPLLRLDPPPREQP